MRIYHKFCQTLARSAGTVVLIANADHAADDGRVIFDNLSLPFAVSLRLGLWRRVTRSFQAFRKALRQQAQIYLVFSLEFVPWALLLKLWTRKPVLFDCMEDFESYARQPSDIPPPLRSVIVLLVRALLWTAGKGLNVVTVADEATRQYFRSLSVNALVVHNFPQLELFPVLEAEQDHDLVYHGSIPTYTFQEMLRIDDALRARGRPVRWLLVGNSPDLAWFRSEVQQRDACGRFHFASTVPHSDVASHIRRARIGIIPLPDLPKFRTNIPQKLFEYMAVGLPVVLSDLPPSRVFIDGKDVAIMVPPSEAEEYADAISRLLDDPQQRAAMGQRGRLHAEAEYNWERESEKLLNAIHGVLPQSVR